MSLETSVLGRRGEYYAVLGMCQSTEVQDCTGSFMFCIDSPADGFGRLLRSDNPD